MAELDPQRIAAVALATLDRCGLSGFTMRAVARALRVTPMALYHHVKGKAALATLVVDAATCERSLPPPTGHWRDDLWAMAHWMRAVTLAHPHIASLRRTFHVWTPSMLRMAERWLALWQHSGLERRRALLAAATSGVAIVGLMEEESILRRLKPPDPSLLSWLPNMRSLFDAEHDFGREFELAVRSLIDGLYARLSTSRAQGTSITARTQSPRRRLRQPQHLSPRKR